MHFSPRIGDLLSTAALLFALVAPVAETQAESVRGGDYYRTNRDDEDSSSTQQAPSPTTRGGSRETQTRPTERNSSEQDRSSRYNNEQSDRSGDRSNDRNSDRHRDEQNYRQHRENRDQRDEHDTRRYDSYPVQRPTERVIIVPQPYPYPVQPPQRPVLTERVFTSLETAIIAEFFSYRYNRRQHWQPPERLRRGDRLGDRPNDDYAEYLPDGLEAQLPVRPGTVRLIYGNDLLLVDQRSLRVLDIAHDVIP